LSVWALGEYLDSNRHRMYQISSSTALVDGVAQGAVSAQTSLEHGDFSLDTFETLDAEMVILDGAIYQVRGDKSVERRGDDFQNAGACADRSECRPSRQRETL